MSSNLRIAQAGSVEEVSLVATSGTNAPRSPIRVCVTAQTGQKLSPRTLRKDHPRKTRLRYCLPYARVQEGLDFATIAKWEDSSKSWFSPAWRESRLYFGGSVWNGVHRYHSWLRLGDVRIPQGAEIVSAKIRFTKAASAYSTQPCKLVVRGVAQADASRISSVAQFEELPLVGSVSWEPGSWRTAGQADTPDISSIVQSIVDQGEWQPGNAAAVVVLDDGTVVGNYTDRRAYGWSAGYDSPRLIVTWRDADGKEHQLRSVESLADERPYVWNLTVFNGVECKTTDGLTQWTDGVTDWPGRSPADWNWLECRRGGTFENAPPVPPWWGQQTPYDVHQRVNAGQRNTAQDDYPLVRQDALWDPDAEKWSNGGHYFKVQLDPVKTDLYSLGFWVTGKGEPGVANKHGLYAWNHQAGQWDQLATTTSSEPWLSVHVGWNDPQAAQPYLDESHQVLLCFFESGGEGAGSHLDSAQLTAYSAYAYGGHRPCHWGTLDQDHVYWLESYYDEVNAQNRLYLVKRPRAREGWRVWQKEFDSSQAERWRWMRFEATRGNFLYFYRGHGNPNISWSHTGKISGEDGSIVDSQWFECDWNDEATWDWIYSSAIAVGPDDNGYFIRRKLWKREYAGHGFYNDFFIRQVVDYGGEVVMEHVDAEGTPFKSFSLTAVDAEGNVYVSGSFHDEADGQNKSGIWKNGSLFWSVYNAHAYGWIQTYMLAVDQHGNVYGLSGQGYSVKLRPDGAEVWQNRIDSAGVTNNCFAVDRLGNFYEGGRGALSDYYSPWKHDPAGLRMHGIGGRTIRILTEQLPVIASELEGLD